MKIRSKLAKSSNKSSMKSLVIPTISERSLRVKTRSNQREEKLSKSMKKAIHKTLFRSECMMFAILRSFVIERLTVLLQLYHY